jgi:glycolate oxidase FAD binding subunit
MADTLQPGDAKDVEAAVQWMLAEGKAAEIVGHGSKRAIGRPAQTDVTLDLSALSGVMLYEPEELVLSAKAATPLAEIEALVASRGQQLAFEPMDYATILGGVAGRGTIGGALAANLSGPRRIKAGAARDHFLGFAAVSGRGETFKSGGRVVKNVTGYDLCKLIAGSWGTLAAMTEVTIKVLPAAETEETLLIRGLEPAQAIEAMTIAMGSACDVSGAAHLPAEVAASIPAVAGAGGSVTALRLEGFSPSVAHRRRLLEVLMKSLGEGATIDASASRALWRAVRDVTPFAASGSGVERPLWRISTAPNRGAELGAALAKRAGAQVLYDWAGGLIWLALAASDDAGAARVGPAVAATGGHATLIRAPAAVRAAIDVFAPQEAGLAALTKRVKEGFDPKGVLNPGRMWAGV